VFTAFHVSVADVTSARQADLQKYALSMLGKSKLAQCAYKKDHKMHGKEVKVLQIAPNSTYRKCKEASHMVLADHPFRQPSLFISPIWTPVIAAEVSKLQHQPV
jgi:hypothetical protein